MHHGIWRDLITHMSFDCKWSLKTKKTEPICTFPVSVSAVKHKEWEMKEILVNINLMTETQQGRSAVGRAIMEFHYEIGY